MKISGMRKYFFFLWTVISINVYAQNRDSVWHYDSQILPGANDLFHYKPIIENKKIAVVANQTSVVNRTHLVDTLLALHFNVVKVFAPEHGFRGDVENGGLINDTTDKKTGLQIVSLYGKHKKPTADDLSNVDVVLFDIQDVGARFYTYISTLQYVMEACAENKKKLIVLDRPNPNGFYIDGPVLDRKFTSFVGMQPVPVVYGMTIGEYARMINSEGWLEKGILCNLKVIPCKNYDHTKYYRAEIPPSPNLPNMNAIYLYPSLCFFEGTPLSIGRGTDMPFQVIGFPSEMQSGFRFMPLSTKASVHPPYENQYCEGIDLRPLVIQIRNSKQLMIKYVLNYYNVYPAKDKYFTDYFNTLAGNEFLQQQIKAQISEQDIRTTWQPDIDKFKLIRKKYLLYKDFE